MTDTHVEHSKHTRAYLTVFAALVVLTIVTVGAATQDFGGHTNIFVALLIAAIKASLVATVFMHLKWERSASIWLVLVACAIFVTALIALPLLSMLDATARTKVGTWG